MNTTIGRLERGDAFEMDGQLYETQEPVEGDPEGMVWCLNRLSGRAYKMHPDFEVEAEDGERATVVRRSLDVPAVIEHGGRSYRAVGVITADRRVIEVTLEDGARVDVECSFRDWMTLASGARASVLVSIHPKRWEGTMSVSAHPLDRSRT